MESFVRNQSKATTSKIKKLMDDGSLRQVLEKHGDLIYEDIDYIMNAIRFRFIDEAEPSMMPLFIIAWQDPDNFEIEDAQVKGIYTVEVSRDLPLSKAASAALDVFHSRISVKCLDDFQFLVSDGEMIIEEDASHESYSGKELGGDIQKISEDVPVYPTEDEVAEWVGTHYQVIFQSQGKAQKKAWTGRYIATQLQIMIGQDTKKRPPLQAENPKQH